VHPFVLYSIAALRRAVVGPIAAKTSVQFAFLGGGADTLARRSKTVDNAASNLRRSRDTARAITLRREEKLWLL
jgi:hypothetical protein